MFDHPLITQLEVLKQGQQMVMPEVLWDLSQDLNKAVDAGTLSWEAWKYGINLATQLNALQLGPLTR